jgi:EAL domain-containing protein (putative c-di-GMP-specific phosphodiesterase class I)/GGDEF domain-containing protein
MPMIVQSIGSGVGATQYVQCRERMSVAPEDVVAHDALLSTPQPLSYPAVLSALSQRLHRGAPGSAVLLAGLPGLVGLQARHGFTGAASLLDRLARAYGEALGERATVLRIGEACFCIHVAGIRNAGHAALEVEKLQRVTEGIAMESSPGLHNEVHFGVALHPLHSSEPEQLVRQAQLAAEAARRTGRRHAVHEEASSRAVLESFELSQALAVAVANNVLQVHFQPKLRTTDRRPAGVEALMRWPGESGPVAGPDVFIPLAESLGLVAETTWLAMSSALRLSQECNGLPVAVNISPAMLHHAEFVDMVMTGLYTWRVPAKTLTLEVTEGALISDFEVAAERLQRLREMGVRISIDDFGTGYSSLSYFKRIPADEIKIDKSFVKGMRGDAGDRRLVETIVNLGRQFGLASVAEGVEDEESLAILAEMGCDHVQGWLFSRALPAEELQAWLAQRQAS